MKKPVALLIAALPMVATAAPEAKVYGLLHLSVDYVNSDIDKSQENADKKLSAGSIGLSSNSSRFGLKGEMDTGVDGLKAFYQIEQGVTTDGDDGDTLATRNSFLGARYLSSEALTLEVMGGRHDTLVKGVMGKTLFKDHAGDYGAILGAGADNGNKFDKRVPNMILGRYIRNTDAGNFVVAVQVSSDVDDKTSKDLVDDSKKTFHAVGFDWSGDALALSVAYDHWNNNSGDQDADVVRGALSWKSGAWTAIALAENIRQSADFDRKAYGLQAGFKSGSWFYAGQVLQAGDYRHSEDTGALMYSLSAQQKLSDNLSIYAVATRTHNEDNATFQGVDGGHGDELAAVTDSNPYALSAGAILKF